MPSKRPERDTPHTTPPALRVYPMALRPGDVLAEDVGEWRVIGHPYTSAGGKTVSVRVEAVKQAGVVQLRASGAHERGAVKRGLPR